MICFVLVYSRANEEIVPNRESFAQLVLDGFDNADPLTHFAGLESLGI